MDNKNQEIINELTDILKKTTNIEKHRGYHILPDRLNSKIEIEELKSKFVFHEKERFQFFKKNVSFKNKTILDIGCNVGYFLFDILDIGAKNVTGYEGKKICGEFIEKAIELLNEKERFIFYNEYLAFDKLKKTYDIIILLNVLHHIGDDYDNKSMDIDTAKIKILEQINNLSKNTSTLIFQLGFNWQGNINQCLFNNGTKSEMIEYIKDGTKDFWQIESIGIPEKENGIIVYKNLNENNIKRDDSLGEFLNRPIFILKSIK